MFLLALALTLVAPLSAHVSGKSFFTDIPTFQLNYPARLAMFREDRRNIKHNGIGGSFQAVVYGGKTTDSAKIASYFLPNNLCNSLVAAEIESDAYLNRQNDVNAEYFNVATADPFNDPSGQTYSARLNFKPRKEIIGLGLTYLQRMGRKWWFDISLPIERARTTMGLTEVQLQAGADTAVTTRENTTTTMVAAFNNSPYLKYGRINGNNWVTSGVRAGDLEIRLGKDIIQTDCAIVGGYLGAVVGLGNRPCGKYMFEPIVGNNHHAGIMYGSYGRFALYENVCGGSIIGVADIVSRYVFGAKETRSFDLKGKPWSRYFQVWTSNAATSLDDIQPLINFSTLKATVNPRLATNLNTGLIFERKGVQLEVGYNAYARNAEDICLCQNLQSGLGIASVQEFLADGQIATASYTIIQRNTLAGVTSSGVDGTNNITDINGSNEVIYVPLTAADLDLDSAAHPAVFAHAVYANLGYSSSNCRVPWFANIGGAYNFSYDNSALHRWTAFVKLGFTF